MPIYGENLVTYEQARGLFPQNPSVISIKRWVREGVRGVKLESTQSGGIRVTSVEAVVRFLQRQEEERVRQKQSNPED